MPVTSHAWTGTAGASTSTESVAGVVRTNLAENPSFETAGSSFIVRTNLVLNPSADSGLTNLTSNGGTGATSTFTQGTDGGYSGPNYSRTSWSVGSTAISGTFENNPYANVPTGAIALSVYVRVNNPQRLQLILTGNTVTTTTSNTAVDVPANTWTRLTYLGNVTTAGQANMRIAAVSGGSGRDWAAGDTLDADAWLMETLSVVGSYFDGSTAAGDDYTYAWTGTANASTSTQSVMAAWGSGGIASLNSAWFQSSRWSLDGSKSLRIVPLSATTDTFSDITGLTAPLQPNTTYTLSATRYLAAPLSGADNRLVRIGTGDGELAVTTILTPSTAAGASRMAVQFTTGKSTAINFFRLYNSAPFGGGDVWYDDLLIEATSSTTPGAWFDGDSGTYGEPITVTATPDTTFSPPRNSVPVTADPGYMLQSGSLYRVQSGARTLVRTQPQMGQSTQIVYDYETPYGSPVTYEFVGAVSPSGPVTEWDETWSSTSAWTVVQGSASVSNGVLSLTPSNGLAQLNRALAGAASYLITAKSMDVGALLAVYYGSSGVSVQVMSATSVQIAVGNVVQNVSVPSASSHQASVSIVGSNVTVTVDGTAYQFSRTSTANPSMVSVQSATAGVWGGEVIAATYSTTTTSVDYTSPQVTNTPASGWIVHPLVPALSVPLSTTDRTLVGVTSIGDRFRVSTATLHPILGQSLPILSTTGPRVAASFVLTLAARTIAQSAQLEAVINDQTPLLIQFPQGSIDEWTPGFYAVIPTTAAGSTDASFGRFAQNTVVPRRVVTWPLQQVQAPIGGVANPGWSYNSVAATYPSYNAAAAAYNSYADMEANNVRS